ncbi:MAG: hypothetical protein IRZ31_11410 [Thermogemmatispora sp.]|uniref:hypothetical protein n=1 Tax=Thermogemmatispora sp. TaxID=1968838 RepID=UPI00261B5FC6|nr:hypothetical protein [Thermogemmatispora sp.]MBX5457499.1 hypothetical protein [Thermogemmatispora sp.]
MHFSDEYQDQEQEQEERGSDELLASDELRLPEGASFLVRLHAVRAWLARRQEEAKLAAGEAALRLQELALAQEGESRLRRRQLEQQAQRQHQARQDLEDANSRLRAYAEAATLLEETVDHISGQRVLVEYYLALSELLECEVSRARSLQERESLLARSPRLQVLQDVLQRVEQVSLPTEGD